MSEKEQGKRRGLGLGVRDPQDLPHQYETAEGTLTYPQAVIGFPQSFPPPGSAPPPLPYYHAEGYQAVPGMGAIQIASGSAGKAVGRQTLGGADSYHSRRRSRLPKNIIFLRNRSISLFVSNLKPTISKVELEAIFCRSGRIVDSFIPTKKSTGLGRGFAFVRFKSEEEANRAIRDNNGKSWGGKKIQVKVADFTSSSSKAQSPAPSTKKRVIEADRGDGIPLLAPIQLSDGIPTLGQKSFAEVVVSSPAIHDEAWAMKDSFGSGVRVAPWVSKEGKRDLRRALVGFLTSNTDGLQLVDNWLSKVCGFMPVRLAVMDEWAIWMLFASEVEAEAALRSALNNMGSSPFHAIERCMEVVGRPPRPCWVRMKGVPIHVWRESVFRKLGDCLGRTIEVDKQTIDRETLVFGRVKVMLGGDVHLPTKLSLWFEDLMTSVVVEEDEVSVRFEGVPDHGSSIMRRTLIANRGSSNEEDDDDVRLTEGISNFKFPSSEDEFNLIFQGRSNEPGLDLESGPPGTGLDLGFELDHGLTPSLVVNASPSALFWLERPTPDVLNSYPSSTEVALGDWEDNGGQLQIVPSSLTAPSHTAGFNTPITTSEQVTRSSWRPECISQSKDPSDAFSPIKRLVLYSSDSDDFSPPMKEACAYDCDSESTPMSVYERGSHVSKELLPLTFCGVLSNDIHANPLSLLEKQDVNWVSVIKQGVEGGWKKVLSVPSTASGSSPVSCDRVSISIPEMDRMDRVASKKNQPQLFKPQSGLHPRGLCLVDSDGPISSDGEINSDWLPSKIKECGQIVGISVDNSKKGWSHLLAFAQKRENQNTQASVRRELNRLASSINYDKGGGSSEVRLRRSKGKKKIQEGGSGYK